MKYGLMSSTHDDKPNYHSSKNFYRLAAVFEHPSPGSAGFQPALRVTEFFFAGKMPALTAKPKRL